MKEVSFVRVVKGSKYQMKITIPQEIVKELNLVGGEKFKVFVDEGGFYYQKAIA